MFFYDITKNFNTINFNNLRLRVLFTSNLKIYD